MNHTKIDSITPTFAVDDLPRALAFYQNVLGFKLAWSWGTPLELAAVCRDSVTITLATRHDARPPGPSRVYLRATDIDAYYSLLQKSGARIVVPIGDRAYGLRDFRISDPFDNELDIGQVLDNLYDDRHTGSSIMHRVFTSLLDVGLPSSAQSTLAKIPLSKIGYSSA